VDLIQKPGALVRLFHPRQDLWDEHFERNGVLIVVRGAVGRLESLGTSLVAFLNFLDDIRLARRCQIRRYASRIAATLASPR
jgi:hypothetical protein